jgi:hypothetical protein
MEAEIQAKGYFVLEVKWHSLYIDSVALTEHIAHEWLLGDTL